MVTVVVKKKKRRVPRTAGVWPFSVYIPGGAPWTPASLFASSEAGAWYDPSDLSTMFTTHDGSTPAAVDGPVGRIEDKSGNNNHALQETAGNRPTLRQSGDLYYLEFDGTTDRMLTASNQTISNPWSYIVGYNAVGEVGANRVNLVEVSVNGVNGMSFGPRPSSARLFAYTRLGSAAVAESLVQAGSAPDGRIAVGSALYTSGNIKIRSNGVELISAAQNLAGESQGSAAIRLGIGVLTDGVLAPFNLYNTVVVKAAISAEDLALTEAYVATKTGATLP